MKEFQVSVDTGKASECIGQMDTCGEAAPAACGEMTQGKVVDGGACRIDIECAKGSTCLWSQSTCSGTCTKLPATGSPCLMADGWGRCDRGAYCDGGTCKKVPGEGEACAAYWDPCADGLQCVGKKCVSYATAAAKCPAHETWEHCEFASESCQNNEQPETCTLSFTLWVEKGKSCKEYDNTVAGVEVSRRCQYPLQCGPDQTCTDPLPAGAACSKWDQCAYPLGCDPTSKTCKSLPKVGEACDVAGLPCDASWCKEAKCAAYPGAGEDCSMSYVCAEGFYCADADMKCAKVKANGESCNSNYECTSDYCTDSKCAAQPCYQ